MFLAHDCHIKMSRWIHSASVFLPKQWLLSSYTATYTGVTLKQFAYCSDTPHYCGSSAITKWDVSFYHCISYCTCAQSTYHRKLNVTTDMTCIPSEPFKPPDFEMQSQQMHEVTGCFPSRAILGSYDLLTLLKNPFSKRALNYFLQQLVPVHKFDRTSGVPRVLIFSIRALFCSTLLVRGCRILKIPVLEKVCYTETVTTLSMGCQSVSTVCVCCIATRKVLSSCGFFRNCFHCQTTK